MTLKNYDKRFLASLILAVAFTAFICFSMALSPAEAAETDSLSQVKLPTIELPQRPKSLVKSAPLVAGGATLGTIVVYDDPSTQRPEDYLELYDRAGSLVVVVWFDQFGIERVAVDRSFVQGEDQLQGVFVPVVEGNFI
jgi:hypothetical protein